MSDGRRLVLGSFLSYPLHRCPRGRLDPNIAIDHEADEALRWAAAKNSRPHWLVEQIARGIQYFAGSLPLAKAVRGRSAVYACRDLGRGNVQADWEYRERLG